MLQQLFTATTKAGTKIEITAQNTTTSIVTTFPIRQIGKQEYVVELTAAQAKELIGVDLPSTMKTARVRLDNVAAWEQFERACYEERRASNPLKAQRDDLVIALDMAIDCGGDVAHPASQKAIQYQAARKALEAFDAAHPEVRA